MVPLTGAMSVGGLVAKMVDLWVDWMDLSWAGMSASLRAGHWASWKDYG